MLVALFSSILYCVLFRWILGHEMDEKDDQGESLTSTCSNVWVQLGSPRLVLAPMVDASELPWRLLSRRYGAQLCYTPMVAAHMFVSDKKLRNEILESTPEDRPLIVQFCGNDAKNMTEAAKLAEPHADGIDINIGCPQVVAKKGRYGAYLQNDWPLLTELVSSLRATVKIPITCKIRIYKDIQKTVEYARMLEKAGCQLLAVHGRTVEQRGLHTGLASWEHIAAVRKGVSIPVFANGNIQCLEDVHRCIEQTGVDGVMIAEGNLYNPKLFAGSNAVTWEVALEYLDLVDQYPTHLTYVRGHVFKIFHHLLNLNENFDVRRNIGEATKLEQIKIAVQKLKDRFIDFHEGRKTWNVETICDNSSNDLQFPPWICQPYVRPTSEEREKRKLEISSSEKVHGYSVRRLKKKRKLEAKEIFERRKKPELCTTIKKNCTNPKGLTCVYNLCRTCCKDYCVTLVLDCIPHRHFKSKQTRVDFLSQAELGKINECTTGDIGEEKSITTGDVDVNKISGCTTGDIGVQKSVITGDVDVNKINGFTTGDIGVEKSITSGVVDVNKKMDVQPVILSSMHNH